MTGLYDAVFGGDLPDTTALISGARELTYPQLAELIDDLAANLATRGIRYGQVVGIQLPNGPEFAVAFHGVVKLGAVATLLPTHLPRPERDAMLASVHAALLIDASTYPDLARPRGALSSPSPAVDPFDLAALPFSSGTTGTPKPVMLPHRALTANIHQFAQVLPLAAGQTCLSMLPFSHIYGLTAQLNVPLYLRARVVAEGFARDRFLSAHEAHNVHLTFIAPPLAPVLTGAPEHIQFPALTTIVSGAAPLDPAAAERVSQRTGARVMQGFGLTESSPVTHLAWQPGTALESIGHPLPGTEIEVRDASGQLTDEGEMWVRGPQVMAGYLGDPDATARTLVEGWLRTGDLVRREPDGSFVVIDRLKDLIKYHGFQVSPVKLERIIIEIPEVADVAVTRGYGDDGEEQPEAHVVLSSPVPEAAIIEYVSRRVSGYEKIRRVHVVQKIPRSPAGKILRRELTA